MKWTKFRLKTTTEAEDIVICALADAGVEGAQAHSLRGHLKKNFGIKSQNWSERTVTSRWRMIC